MKFAPKRGVKQRLYTEAVARQKYAFARRIVHRKRKNAVEMLGALLTVENIAPKHGFGVTRGVKFRAHGREGAAQLGRVIDLTVVNNGIGISPKARLHGLCAACGVHHRQTIVKEPRTRRKKRPRRIGAAMRKRLTRAPHLLLCDPQRADKIHTSVDRTHMPHLAIFYERGAAAVHIMAIKGGGRMLPIPSQQTAGRAFAAFGAGALCAWFLPGIFMGVFGAALVLTAGYLLTRYKGGELV